MASSRINISHCKDLFKINYDKVVKGEKMKSAFLIIFIYLLSVQVSDAQWTLDTNGIGYTSEFSFVVSGNNIFAGTFNTGVFLSSNNGSSWAQTGLNNQYVISLAANGSIIFAGTYGNGVYVSTNSGTTFTQTSLINKYVPSLLVIGNNIYAGVYYDGVYLSTNNGATWTQTSLNNRDVYSLAVSGSTIFAGTYLNGVYTSTNNGSTWTQTSLNNQSIQSLFINGTDIFAGTYFSAGVYLTTNNGTSWAPTSFSNKSVYSFAVSGSTIFAGSDGYGVYTSTNRGANWVQRNEGFLGSPRVFALCILNGFIYAATDYDLYRRPLSDIIGINPISEQVPAHYSLEQNYPNPFNPTTKIKFALTKNSFTNLVIYDALGREIETIVNEQLNPGTYAVNWSAGKLSSGMYFYTLKAGDFVDTKKMLLIK